MKRSGYNTKQKLRIITTGCFENVIESKVLLEEEILYGKSVVHIFCFHDILKQLFGLKRTIHSVVAQWDKRKGFRRFFPPPYYLVLGRRYLGTDNLPIGF